MRKKRQADPSWAAQVVDRLDAVENAWTDPMTAYRVIAAFMGNGSAASVVHELMKRGAIVKPSTSN
ncbi:hypothetical protein KBY28_06500 [Ruegeria pomeroyi]|uniref:hypothetical protein n=1 Tax=Ruegeria pomeroyi TaxID=89184 RepID=UPI001F299ECB|nr:hypothetical protein [Ruegeria pomeroyi]MCE8508097.1 hypothetical protein [Ruegeria pomeroyi]